VVANFALRPWPWIVVGLVALVDFPGLADPEEGYVRVMLAQLPAGLLGLMVATFMAAYMSTIDTHLNWGASYLTHDVYRRFLRPAATERDLVTVARLSVTALAALGALATLGMTSIEGAWKFLASISAGAGLIVLLRWLWWRINAWSEISVMTASLVATNALLLWSDIAFPFSLALVVAISVPFSIGVTLCTPPEPLETLAAFYRRVRPPGFWGPVARAIGAPEPRVSVARGPVARVAAGTFGVYGWLIGGGWLMLGRPGAGAAALVLGALALAFSAWPLTAPRSARSRT
jgi:Na+/proline symporter